MANTHQVLQGVKDYTLELLGEEYRDVEGDVIPAGEQIIPDGGSGDFTFTLIQ